MISPAPRPMIRASSGSRQAPTNEAAKIAIIPTTMPELGPRMQVKDAQTQFAAGTGSAALYEARCR